MLTSYSPSADEWSLPAIIPVKIKGETFWAYLDTGAGRNFITSEAAKRLNLKAERHEVREILTVNGSKRQSMPIFNISIESLDGKASEKIQVTGTKLGKGKVTLFNVGSSFSYEAGINGSETSQPYEDRI